MNNQILTKEKLSRFISLIGPRVKAHGELLKKDAVNLLREKLTQECLSNKFQGKSPDLSKSSIFNTNMFQRFMKQN